MAFEEESVKKDFWSYRRKRWYLHDICHVIMTYPWNTRESVLESWNVGAGSFLSFAHFQYIQRRFRRFNSTDISKPWFYSMLPFISEW